MIDASAMDRDALTALLRWYADMGVDCPLDAEPVDRFAQSQQKLTRPAPEFAEAEPSAPPQRSLPPRAAPQT